MVINEALKISRKKIGNRNTDLLFTAVMKMGPLQLILQKNDEIDEDTLTVLRNGIQRILSGEPLQYVTGETEFMSLPFLVNPNVLIPRSDTETLVEYIIDNAIDNPDILEIGTGSGCIAVSLASYIKKSRVTAMDISSAALETAKKNAELNSVSVNFIKHDIMTDFDGRFDIIVSNPPYIETSVIPTLDKNVRDFEPHIALDGGSDGLDFYRRIVKTAPQHLNSGGMLCFEVGHTQANEVSRLMKECFETEIIKDLCKVNRVVAGRLIG